jgi:hypothetical protein
MALNRPLRARNRRLPSPPDMERKSDETTKSKSISERELVPKALSENVALRLDASPANISDPASPYAGVLSKAPVGRPAPPPSFSSGVSAIKGERNELISELTGVFSRGISGHLGKVDIKKIESETNVDYAAIWKTQLQRAIDDYLQAGKKMLEAGLKSNAALSLACSVFASMLAAGELFALEQWETIQESMGQDLTTTSMFNILHLMFEALSHRSKQEIAQVIEALKRIETFSLDDQELIANIAEYLAARAKSF